MNEVNLKKIAEVLGLSISTVSRALKNHPDISTKTKKRVMETAETLHYVPNLNAVNLRNRNSRVFGVLVPSITNSFYVSFINALETEARTNNYSLMILQSGDRHEKELEILNTFRQNRIQGLFACLSPETNNIDNFLSLTEMDIPVIFYDKVPDYNNESIKITMDDTHAAELAAEAMIRANRKNILALFGNKNMSICKKREKSFTQTLATAKNVTTQNEYCLSSDEAKNACFKYFRKKTRPDAVFCMSDEILIGVMRAFIELKINYPTEVGVIAISEGYFPRIYYPEITYVETSGEKLGKTCFEKMIQLLEKNEGLTEINVPSVLVPLGSL